MDAVQLNFGHKGRSKVAILPRSTLTSRLLLSLLGSGGKATANESHSIGSRKSARCHRSSAVPSTVQRSRTPKDCITGSLIDRVSSLLSFKTGPSFQSKGFKTTSSPASGSMELEDLPPSTCLSSTSQTQLTTGSDRTPSATSTTNNASYA
jgi:hypothetical protein